MYLLAKANGLDTWLEPMRRAPGESVLLTVLWQLSLIILAARFFAWLAHKLGQPSVVGEIAAGLILGPSVLGYFWPGLEQAIFHPHLAGVEPAVFDVVSNWIFSTLSQLGLIFLLFLIGLEFDFSHLRWHGKAALNISVAGVMLPFALGLALAPLLLPHLENHPLSGQPVNAWGFALFLGTALSITAIPVLGRIMVELEITRTRLGAITISAAAIDDTLGWILLASVAAVVRGNFNVGGTLTMAAETIAFVAAMFWLVRPALIRWARRAIRRGDGELAIGDLALLLLMVMAAAMATNLIGVFAVFGPFCLGAILSGERDFCGAVMRRLRDFMAVFFLPVFFTYTGLRTNIGALDRPALWLLFGAVVAAAMFGKIVGCGAAAWFSGFSRRESACIGAMMNTRGLMELVIVNLGYEMQVIPPSVFCMLVLMAMITNLATTPSLIRLARGTELECAVQQSEFYRRGAAHDNPIQPASTMPV